MARDWEFKEAARTTVVVRSREAVDVMGNDVTGVAVGTERFSVLGVVTHLRSLSLTRMYIVIEHTIQSPPL